MFSKLLPVFILRNAFTPDRICKYRRQRNGDQNQIYWISIQRYERKNRECKGNDGFICTDKVVLILWNPNPPKKNYNAGMNLLGLLYTRIFSYK
jgi:hypothetical protein